MNTLEINLSTLANLYEQYPQSFEGITLDGECIVLNGERANISGFNINELLTADNHFMSSLGTLKPEDTFKIIRLHTTLLGGDTEYTKKTESLSETEQRAKIIKQENPLMRNISVITKNEDGIKREYINVVGSDGVDHLYTNDRNVNVFDVYDLIKFQKGGDNVTPDELIEIMNRKLHDVRLQDATTLMDSSVTSEDFVNKLDIVNKPYEDEKTVRVVASEEHDIAVIDDLTNPANHKVVTFDENQFGDLVVNQHEQNVIGTDTIVQTGDATSSTFESEDVEAKTEHEVFEKDDEEVKAVLISAEEFYDLLNSPHDLTEEQRENVNLWYAYLGDLILYEDYLAEELRNLLAKFRAYVYDLQYGEHEIPINYKQEEAVNKLSEMELQNAATQENLTAEKSQEAVKKLEYIRPSSTGQKIVDEDNQGSVSIVQIILFIVGVAIILTAVTLFLINK